MKVPTTNELNEQRRRQEKGSYSDVRAQIEALEREAEVIRAQELDAVIAEVRARVEEYGLTEQDLFGHRRGKGSSAQKVKGTPMYRDPKTGATWTGRGRAPAWIVNAKNRDRFLIEAS